MPERSLSVLFLCVANSCRSQMAEAIARKRYPNHNIDSAGDQPAGQIHPSAQRFLEGKGYDLSTQRSKHTDDVLPLKDYDAVVGLCAEACVVLPESVGAENWDLPDPSAVGGAAQNEAFEIIYKTLNEKIDDLFRRLSA